MRGISAGKYDKGNKNIMMRGIWVEEIWNIYCCQVYIYCLSLALSCYSQNHNQLLKHLLFAFKIFFDQIFVHLCFMGGFNLWRCSYDQAVFSKFMPRIVLCGCPYDITASWQKTFHCFYTLSQSKLLENRINLHSGSYMYLLIAYMAVPPPPPGEICTFVCVTYLFSEYSCSS